MEEKEKVKAVTLYEHPDFRSGKEFYKKVENFLRPKGNILKTTDYLWLHQFEDDTRMVDPRDQKMARADRALRETRTQYVNYLGMVANRVISLIMKGGINFNDDIETLFKDYKDNVDGQNKNLESFFTSLFLDDVAFGCAFCMVNASTNQTVTSLGDELQGKNRPFFVRLHPLDFKDWEVDNSGAYVIFRYEYEVLSPRKSLRDEPMLNKFSEEWSLVVKENASAPHVSAQKYISVNKKNVAVNYYRELKGDNVHSHWSESGAPVELEKLSDLPISVLSSEHAWLEDVLPIVLKIYNKQSDLDNIIYSNGYDKTFIKANLDQAVNGDGKPLTDDEKLIKISHNSITIIPPDSDVIRLEPTYPQATFDSLKDDISSLFQVAFNMLRVAPPDSKVGEAADARKELKEDLLTRVNEKRTHYLSFIHKSIANFAKFLDTNSSYESKAEFVKSLEQSDIDEFVLLMRQTADVLRNYPLWEKEVHKRLAQEMMLPDEDKILGEIDSVDLKALREAEMAQVTSGITGLVNTKNKAGAKP